MFPSLEGDICNTNRVYCHECCADGFRYAPLEGRFPGQLLMYYKERKILWPGLQRCGGNMLRYSVMPDSIMLRNSSMFSSLAMVIQTRSYVTDSPESALRENLWMVHIGAVKKFNYKCTYTCYQWHNSVIGIERYWLVSSVMLGWTLQYY